MTNLIARQNIYDLPNSIFRSRRTKTLKFEIAMYFEIQRNIKNISDRNSRFIRINYTYSLPTPQPALGNQRKSLKRNRNDLLWHRNGGNEIMKWTKISINLFTIIAKCFGLSLSYASHLQSHVTRTHAHMPTPKDTIALTRAHITQKTNVCKSVKFTKRKEKN